MDIKIIEKKGEPLLSRDRLSGEIFFEAVTPSYEDLKKKLSSSINCDEKLIAIKNIYTKFGMKKGEFLAFVYYSEEAMEKIEPRQKEKKEVKEEKHSEKPEKRKEKPEEKKSEESLKEGKKEEKVEQKEEKSEKKEEKK